MQLTELKLEFPFSKHPERTDGVHVSQIIKSIMMDMDAKIKKEITEEDRLLMEAGFMWEKTLERGWGDLLGKRPSEVQLDGIYGSPDGLLEDGTLEEYKFTKMSSDKRPEENLRWMMQVKAYCKMLNTNKCRLHVLHINGNYKPPMPKYKVWELEFGTQEIEENWRVLTSHAKAKGWLR